MFLRKLLVLILAAAILVIIYYYMQPTRTGSGSDTSTRYELVEDWLHLPANFELGNPTGLAVDTGQNLLVFHRAGRTWPLFGMPEELINDKTILVIDKDSGKIMDSWGEDLFIMPHGLSVDRNSRVVKFNSSGKYLLEWGTKGDGPGQFNIPHAIDLDNQGNVYVADRENKRIQVFTPDGKFIRSWTGDSYGNIFSVVYDSTRSAFLVVDDYTFLKIRHRGSDVFVLDTAGHVRSRFGRSGGYDLPPGWYHDATVDRKGDIYVGDILNNKILRFAPINLVRN